MLTQVQRLINEHRSRPEFHTSQQDPAYLQLMIMEQALQARVSEQNITPVGTTSTTTGTAAAAQRDPKTKAVMDKVSRGQALTPDEQQTVNKIALAAEEKRPARMVREQSELQQAQVVLAAQDMIDRLQGMLEDISEMQFKDLPALADSIKNDMGVDQSTQFQSAASTALTNLLQAVQAGKTEMESAQGVLTGQPMAIPGSEPVPMEPESSAGEEELDLSLDTNLEPDQEEPETGAAALGRERR